MRRLFAVFLAAAAGSIAGAPSSLPAQSPAQPPQSAAAPGTDSTVALIEGYVRAHQALAAVRDKEQAELAEPRSKKTEVQAEIRERYRGVRVEALKAVGYTEAKFNAVTKRISTDDSLRLRFEATLARQGAR